MADIMVTLQKLANENTAKTFQYNKQEAATSRAWQEKMSNTSHQREVKDLVAAGLNPVLSSGGSGAQSYSTQSASGTADSAVNAIGNVQSSRNSAAATRYAADQSLKASQAMASAQMYSAQMAYAAQKYSSDRNAINNFANNMASFRRLKLQTDTDKWIAQNKQASNAYSLLDKYCGNPSLKGVFKDFVDRKEYSNLFTQQSKLAWKPANMERIANSVTKNYYNSVAKALDHNGYVASKWNVAYIIHQLATAQKVDFNMLVRKGDHKNSAFQTARFM